MNRVTEKTIMLNKKIMQSLWQYEQEITCSGEGEEQIEGMEETLRILGLIDWYNCYRQGREDEQDTMLVCKSHDLHARHSTPYPQSVRHQAGHSAILPKKSVKYTGKENPS